MNKLHNNKRRQALKLLDANAGTMPYGEFLTLLQYEKIYHPTYCSFAIKVMSKARYIKIENDYVYLTDIGRAMSGTMKPHHRFNTQDILGG